MQAFQGRFLLGIPSNPVAFVLRGRVIRLDARLLGTKSLAGKVRSGVTKNRPVHVRSLLAAARTKTTVEKNKSLHDLTLEGTREAITATSRKARDATLATLHEHAPTFVRPELDPRLIKVRQFTQRILQVREIMVLGL